jgi:hypothetical protein
MEPKAFHRKLTAILSADVAGYSRLMQDDEAATVLTLESYKQAFFESKLPFGYEFLGEQTVKNIARPVGAYKVLMEPRITKGKGARCTVQGSRRRILAFGLAGALLIIAGAALWQFFLRPSPPPVEKADPKKMALPLPDKPSIAVLPFTNLTDDPKQDFFSDGLAEEIIIALTKLPEVFVIARNSSFAYKEKAPGLRQVGRELGMKYVLEGERALALALNENLAEGHAFMGRIHLTRGQHDEAVKRGEQAAALAPNSDFALAAWHSRCAAAASRKRRSVSTANPCGSTPCPQAGTRSVWDPATSTWRAMRTRSAQPKKP